MEQPASFMQKDCPPAELWYEFALDRVSDDTKLKMGRHVAICPSCAQILAAIANSSGDVGYSVTKPKLESQCDSTKEFLSRDRIPITVAAPSTRDQFSSIADYEILEEIARGGMGVVYKARHIKLGRIAALKLMKSGDIAGEEEVRRFQTEALAAALLDHPNIVPVFEAGECFGRHFIALAFVDGSSLWNRVRESPLEPEEAARIIETIARAIQFAHDRGIIHRDLKPQNILIARDGTPKVTDFGLAKRTYIDSSLTGTGAAIGTPSYMPPEQAAGQQDQVSTLSDIYSLGATLYAILTGRHRFKRLTLYRPFCR